MQIKLGHKLVLEGDLCGGGCFLFSNGQYTRPSQISHWLEWFLTNKTSYKQAILDFVAGANGNKDQYRAIFQGLLFWDTDSHVLQDGTVEDWLREAD